jgi:hypothetical protein
MLTSDVVTWWGGESEGVSTGEGESPLAGAWLLVLTPPPVPLGGVCDAVKSCVQGLRHHLATAGAIMADMTQLRFFIPQYSTGPSFSFEGLGGLNGSVVVTTCEGYYGQSGSVSLLALLLPPSHHAAH